MNTKTNNVKLQGGVNLKNSDFNIKTPTVIVESDQKQLKSNDMVSGTIGRHIIKSQGFDIKQDGQKIILKGKTILKLE